jgi:hypothetical protein
MQAGFRMVSLHPVLGSLSTENPATIIFAPALKGDNSGRIYYI